MRSNASPEAALSVLAACLLEAAWITLVYVTVESLAGTDQQPLLSLVGFAGAALLGLVFARVAGRDGRQAYRTMLAAIVVAAALIGWLLPLGPAAAQVLDKPAVVFGMHPAGILLGLAVLRGSAHATARDDERVAETALGPGLAGVAGLWVFLTATGGTAEPSVVGTATSATVVFVTAGLVSIGLARLADLRASGLQGADRRRWVGVLFGVVAGLLAIAVPLAIILGVPLADAIRGGAVVVNVVVAAAVALFLVPAALLGIVLYLIIEFLRAIGGGGTTDFGDLLSGAALDVQGMLGPGGGGPDLSLVGLVIAVVVAFVVVRALVKRPGRSVVDGDVVEVREGEGPIGIHLRRPRLPLPRRHPVPRTASEAYVASLEVLARRPESMRRASETPAEHARRIRADPTGPPMGRLAADYALIEFGKRTLPPSEHRRAIERWRRLRATDA